MRFLDLTLPTVPENLALDEALLLQAEEEGGPEVLRVWETPHQAVVLGASGKIAEEIDLEACKTDRIGIFRRASGGGTVLLGPGCLLYTLILSFERDPRLTDIRASYAYILEILASALSTTQDSLHLAGTSDLARIGQAVPDCKVSGNAQQRKRSHVLHHGTLLYDFAVVDLQRYLRLPPRQPEYREQRGHAEFVTNLPHDAAQLRGLLRTAWQADAPLENWPRQRVARLVAEKYGSDDWVYRR